MIAGIICIVSLFLGSLIFLNIYENKPIINTIGIFLFIIGICGSTFFFLENINIIASWFKI